MQSLFRIIPATLALISLMPRTPAQSRSPGQLLIQKKCGTQRAHLWLDNNERNYPALFNEIRVLDARPDTSRIGIVRVGVFGQDEILFQASAATQLTGYLNATYARPKGGHSILIVLKDLWVACPESKASR